MNADLYAVPINAPTSIKINGRDLREFGIELTGYPNIMLPPVRERTQVIDGRAGSRDFGGTYDNWAFTITGQIRGLNHNDFVVKKTAFLRWIDMQQHKVSEWLVGQKTVRTLKLELSGHKYFYTNGTVAVTQNNKVVTGTSTKWKSYIRPGAEFRLSGNLTPRYTVASVDSDTQITLSANIAESTDSGLSYQLERKRFLLVNYNGTSDLSSITHALFKSNVFNFSVGFRTTYPYWVGEEFEEIVTAPSAGDFVEVLGVGTAPFGPVYQIVGAATNPEICACEKAFEALFDGTTASRTILNKADVLASTSDQTYKPTRNDKGIYITSGVYAYYSNVPGYPDRFSFVVRLKTQFAYDAATDKHIFNWFTDANNAFRLFYDASDDDWVITIRSGAANNDTLRTSNSQTFANGDEIEIGGWYDTNGRDIEGTTYYGKLFVNGVEAGLITSNPTKPVGNLAELYVGSIDTTTEHAESIIDELTLFVRALSDQEIVSIYNDGDQMQNNNATITYTGTLASNDILTLDTNSGNSEFYDASAGTKTFPTTLSGKEPSLRGDEEDELAILYLPAAISGELRILYRPHFR